MSTFKLRLNFKIVQAELINMLYFAVCMALIIAWAKNCHPLGIGA